MNIVTLTGNLGRDPEIKYTPNGVAICSFRIAVTHSFKKGDTWKKESHWFDIVVFSKLAEVVASGAKKGDKVYVYGRLKSEEWEDKSGAKRKAVKVCAESVEKVAFWSEKAPAKPEVAEIEDVPF